jgi:hypothetical protein
VNARNTDSITTNNIRLDPRFGLASAYQGSRSIRLSARFRF